MKITRAELSDQFLNNFINKLNITDEQIERIVSFIEVVYLPKKYFFVKPGQVTTQKAYLNKGVTRSFTMDEKGGEHILHFSFEDYWVGDFESLQTGKPGTLYIQALEDCEFYVMSKSDCDFLCDEITPLKQLFDKKHEAMAFATINRLNEVKTLTAEERYLKLLDKHPEVFQRVPLQYIASYLDIEPQSFSRLRKRIFESYKRK